jgi:D-alanine transaminase
LNIVYLNERYLPSDQASISVMDRGFLFGDGVYEVIPVYAGRLFQLEQHLARLQHSLSAINLALEYDQDDWRMRFDELIKRNQAMHCSIYLQITRGAYETRDHRFPKQVKPTVFMRLSQLPSQQQQPSSDGLALHTTQDIRWQRCDIKAITLLANCMARQAAEQAGADEALLINEEGLALECASSNLFMIKQSKVYTAPLSNHILGGITRSVAIEASRNAGLEVVEETFTRSQLLSADEVWITSSSKEIRRVSKIDQHTIGDGDNAAIWQRVIEEYMKIKQKLYNGVYTG